MKLVVFCVETDRKAQIDTKYIDKAIREFYLIDNNIKVSYIYLNGKGNYNKKSITNQIKEKFSGDFDEKHVVYCIDLDSQADSNVIEVNEKIKEYCIELKYNLVWFCRDIEEVFLHKKVNQSIKVEESNKFSRTKGLCKANIQTLSSNFETPKHSNLLLVLDNFMTRKLN